LNTLLIHFSDS